MHSPLFERGNNGQNCAYYTPDFIVIQVMCDDMSSIIFMPPYGSMGGILSLLCVCFLFVCFLVCTVTHFSALEKDRGAKFCMRVQYYLDRSSVILEVKGQGHQGQKTRMHEASSTCHLPAHAARLSGQSELGAAASRNVL